VSGTRIVSAAAVDNAPTLARKNREADTLVFDCVSCHCKCLECRGKYQ
jgi:hypothetical protein